MRGARAGDLGVVLDRLQQRDRIAAAHRLAAGGGDHAAQRIGAGCGIDGDRGLGLRQPLQLNAELVGFRHIGMPLEVIARAVRKLAAVDEYGRPAVLRHQRIGERQRRVRDVGAADVERPRHRVRVGHHQRVGAQFDDLVANARELRRFSFAGIFQLVHRDLAERRGRALLPDGIDGVALDRDQLRAGLGAGGLQPLHCRRSVQPRVESEAVAGLQLLRQPGLRRRLDQRRHRPCGCIDLLGRLQGVAAVDEQHRAVFQHGGEAGRAGEAGQPGQPFVRRRDIFVLLGVGARYDEAGEIAPGQLLAQRGQAG